VIKWCAYCQHFQHEAEPFDQYVISHGICPACMPMVPKLGKAEKPRILELQQLFQDILALSMDNSRSDLTQVYKRSRRLGLKPLDLMMGMLQPLLVNIGQLWAQGQVTVATEHRFSAMVGDLVAEFRRDPSVPPRPEAPELIMVTAEDNYHTLGLQMADAYLASRGIPTLTVMPGLPTLEVLELIRRHKPKAVGFSVALPIQMKQVREVAEAIKVFPSPPEHLLVGGPAVRMGLNPDPYFGVEVCHNLNEVPVILAKPPLALPR
jgi:methanogenic corrinoid protein MtbC1